MRNITLTCPACGEPERAVGDPDERVDGHKGTFYCFNCKTSGEFELHFTWDAPDPSNG